MRLAVPAMVCVAMSLLAPAVRALAQSAPVAAVPVAAPVPAITILGPPPPVAPSIINRDSEGRVTLRATRISSPPRIDGTLDEELYTLVPFVSDFIQNDPRPGAPASEKTDVWVMFDDDNIYVVGRCWTKDMSRLVATEMRRDNGTLVQNDQFAWSFDTFYDRRNATIFEVGASGGRIDGQVTNERQVSLDFNPIWQVRTRRYEWGYVVEAAVPFKSLRFNPGRQQVWGFQARRHLMVGNEYSYLTRLPASVGSQGHFRASLAATLVGLEVPAGFKNLDIKPFITSSVSTDRLARPAISNDPSANVGVDVKYGVTRSLAIDATVNTDFGQVEADEQQVNLTRFNLFFPEKRDFFLENAGTFAFANVSTSGAQAGSTDAPILFYSRQIGLVQGQQVPIRAGGRLSGRAGRQTIGVLNVQTGENADGTVGPTNFSVVRLKRDILTRSSIGIIATNRTVGVTSAASNQTYGVDGSFSFGPDVAIITYWAGSNTENGSRDHSYRGFLEYNGDRYGVQAEHLMVGSRFDPQIGFVRRRDMRKNLAMLRFSPRPKNSRVVRKYWYAGSFTNIDNHSGQLETRIVDALFEAQLQNSDKFFAGYTDNHEFLPAPFTIAPGFVLPVASYDFASGRVGYNFGRQHPLSGNVLLDSGSFYDGTKTTISVSSGRINAGSQLSFEPGISINRVRVGPGRFTAKVITSRVSFTMTPFMFVSALLQYNSSANTVAANVRFRWEYQPGSEMFVVFNEQRDTVSPSFPGLQNRSFIVKVNRVFRY